MTETSGGDTEIRPFRVEIPEADIDVLRARIAATRWPEKETSRPGKSRISTQEKSAPASGRFGR
jgi:hypothetical protein